MKKLCFQIQKQAFVDECMLKTASCATLRKSIFNTIFIQNRTVCKYGFHVIY